MPWCLSRLGLTLCGDVPLDYFGLPRCFVTFKPLLIQVTVLYGKSLGLHREKSRILRLSSVLRGCGRALAAGVGGTLGPKKFFLSALDRAGARLRS
jgi:hypothetical protein